MNQFWSAGIRELAPYVPGLQTEVTGAIKLNTNESPYGPSPDALAAMRAAADDRLRLYPDPQSRALCTTVAEMCGLCADQVYVGNGSDEVLAHVFMALLKQDAPLTFPALTYGFYPVYCRILGIDYTLAPLQADYGIDVDALHAAPGPVIFPNPNAPTGLAVTREAIAALLSARPDRVLVVDEAYVDFGAESAVPLIDAYPNLLVVQTMSKSRGLAGLRVGFALGQSALIEALRRVKDSLNSYPVGRIAEAGAVAALRDEAYFRCTVHKVVTGRTKLSASLRALGFEVLPSLANFVFARHPALSGADLTRALHDRGVLVRHFPGPVSQAFIRISVGNDSEVERLITVLGQIL